MISDLFRTSCMKTIAVSCLQNSGDRITVVETIWDLA